MESQSQIKLDLAKLEKGIEDQLKDFIDKHGLFPDVEIEFNKFYEESVRSPFGITKVSATVKIDSK